jgi:hypothetical protein
MLGGQHSAASWKTEQAFDNQIWDAEFLNDDEENEQKAQDDGGIEHSDEEMDESRLQSSVSSSAPRNSQRIDPLDQHQSALLTLPYDIRALIWTSVVGGGLVHITELRNTLGQVACMDRCNRKWGMWQHDCWYCSLVVCGTLFNFSLQKMAIWSDFFEKQHLNTSYGWTTGLRCITVIFGGGEEPDLEH